MKLSYFPQLKVVHTSQLFHGQIYIPLANWLLMVGTILVASIYNNVWVLNARDIFEANLLTDDLTWERLRGVCHVCDVFRYMYGISHCHFRLASQSVPHRVAMACHRLNG